MVKLIVLFLLPFALAETVPAQPALELGETDVVVAVIDGDTVELSDGSEVRLIGLQAPKLPLGRSGFATWPLAPEAKAYLRALVEGRTVVLGYGGRRMDRYNRRLAQVFREDGLWVQGQMIAGGMARVYSFADNRACVRQLYDLEKTARSKREGIWGLNWYRVRDAFELERDIDTYQVIEGTPLSVAEVRGRFYLNFGEDRFTDFTATVSPRDARLFLEANFDLFGLESEQIRLRGWVSSFDGPNLQLTHPEQIEIIDDTKPSPNEEFMPCQLESLAIN